jgi:hypothetical protein
MTSNINPNNIDGAYPVAGQDNDSQGFRDNFTNIKTNFVYASAEITDLQVNTVLKSALTGTTLNNNMNGSSLSNAQMFDITEPKLTLGTVSSATLNYAASPYYTLSTGSSVTISFSNLPAAGSVARLRLQISVTNTDYTLILPGAVSVGVNNLLGYDSVSGSITFNATGVYEYEFETSDGGSTISIFDLNNNRDPIYLPSLETVTANANLSLVTTTSMITMAGNFAGNLADGYNGQLKIIACGNSAVNTYQIGVDSAGWKGGAGGNIFITAQGSAATLMFVNNAWYVTGTGLGVGNVTPRIN